MAAPDFVSLPHFDWIAVLSLPEIRTFISISFRISCFQLISNHHPFSWGKNQEMSAARRSTAVAVVDVFFTLWRGRMTNFDETSSLMMAGCVVNSVVYSRLHLHQCAVSSARNHTTNIRCKNKHKNISKWWIGLAPTLAKASTCNDSMIAVGCKARIWCRAPLSVSHGAMWDLSLSLSLTSTIIRHARQRRRVNAAAAKEVSVAFFVRNRR